jgi:VWFA-related protein
MALPAIVAVSLVGAAWMGGTTLVAQAPAGNQSPAPQTPVFRSSVRLIDVDVYVTDQQGRPIKGLTQDSFELLEDGKPQEVRAFSAVDLPVTSRESSVSDARTADSPEPDVVTNIDPGRLWVVLLDSPYAQFPEGTGLQQFGGRGAYDLATKRVASQFIREAVGPRDQVAIIFVQGPKSASQGLTGNRRLLQDAIDKYGQGLSGASSAPERCPATSEIAQRIMDTYRALSDVSERLGGMSGRRKTIIWIGGQLPYTFEQPAGCPPPPMPNAFTVQNVLDRQWPTIMQARRDAMRMATRTNVAIFPVDPAGLTTDLGAYELQRLSALREVAEETGGSAVVGTNNFAGGYQRIVQENSTYYMLGYSPAQEYHDGKFHSIQVRVKQRPELVVHARRGYSAPDADAKPAALPPLPEGVSIAARDALRSPAPLSGVGIDLATAVFKASPTGGTVVLDAQLRGAGLKLDSGARITVSYQVLDLDGRILTGAYKGFNLDLREQSRTQVLESGMRFVDRLTLKPGRYEVRLVADQPDNDVLGSVVTHVEVPEFNETLSMGGVLIGSISTSEQLTLHSDGESRKQVSVDPTAIRRFPQGDEIAVYVELYQRQDRAGDLDVTASIVSREGKVLLKEDAMGLDDTSSAERSAFRAQLGLGDLPPGAYVLRVEGTSSRDGVEPVRRQIPITIVEE